ncbi:MAG: hypothetical protein K9G29_10035 [Crocinitomicaceae bacterium]|nr:hypothetical protein [Crocinitomicaceae bacterium]
MTITRFQKNKYGVYFEYASDQIKTFGGKDFPLLKDSELFDYIREVNRITIKYVQRMRELKTKYGEPSG